MKKNNLIKNKELIGANLKYNNFMNKNEKKDNSNNNKSKATKKVKEGNQQTKIRKRNENKIWNINNTLNGNITLSLNILNKTKFGEKNSKNMTHDIPYMAKLTNNLVNKLKSIQYSKEKLREQILKTGNTRQNQNKTGNVKKIINKFRNLNNKGPYNGYQNTKNTSSSKNLVNNNNKKETIKISKIGIPSAVNPIKEKLEKNNNNINNTSKMKNKGINRNILNNNNNNNFINQNNFLR